jgi:hypothetical protein
MCSFKERTGNLLLIEKLSSMTKSVTVFNTRGSNVTELPNVTADTWGELQQLFDEVGIRHSGMNCIEADANEPFSDPQAKLPGGNFVIYVFPTKVNSGAYLTLLHRAAA